MSKAAQSDQPVRKGSSDGNSTSRAKAPSLKPRAAIGGLLPDPAPQAVLSPQHLYTPEPSIYFPGGSSRPGIVSPILSYGQLPVLAPPAPYPGYFVQAPTVNTARVDEPRLESTDDFPEICAAVPTKRKSFGKFPKKRQQVK